MLVSDHQRDGQSLSELMECYMLVFTSHARTLKMDQTSVVYYSGMHRSVEIVSWWSIAC